MREAGSQPPFQVAALYHFSRLDDIEAVAERLRALCRENGIRGTLILAPEGVNGTVAGSRQAIAALLGHLRAIAGFEGLEAKFSHAAAMPFHRMKVRLKKEIVTLGVDGIDPVEGTGIHVGAREWNALIRDPDTVVVDTRNDYEVAIGSFQGAVNPETQSFREFPDWVRENRDRLEGRKVAMFCTGGIRCEKATAFVRALGLDEVYHLKGGILKYLEEIRPEDSLWQGECFVFDERVSVGHGLQPGTATLCRACRHPLTEADRSSKHYLEGVSCPHCHAARDERARARYAERQRQVELAARRGDEPHIGG